MFCEVPRVWRSLTHIDQPYLLVYYEEYSHQYRIMTMDGKPYDKAKSLIMSYCHCCGGMDGLWKNCVDRGDTIEEIRVSVDREKVMRLHEAKVNPLSSCIVGVDIYEQEIEDRHKATCEDLEHTVYDLAAGFLSLLVDYVGVKMRYNAMCKDAKFDYYIKCDIKGRISSFVYGVLRKFVSYSDYERMTTGSYPGFDLNGLERELYGLLHNLLENSDVYYDLVYGDDAIYDDLIDDDELENEQVLS